MTTYQDRLQVKKEMKAKVGIWASQVVLAVKNPPANAGDTRDEGSAPGLEDPLETDKAAHSSILAWRIPWTEEPRATVYGISRESDMTEATEHTCIPSGRCPTSLDLIFKKTQDKQPSWVSSTRLQWAPISIYILGRDEHLHWMSELLLF